MNLYEINYFAADLPTLQVVLSAIRATAAQVGTSGWLLDNLADELERRMKEIAATGGPVEGD